MEKDLHKSNYDRLLREYEILQRENNSRSSILSNLEMLRTSCERNERETKLILTQKIEHMEKENLIQKKQLEHDKEQHAVMIKSWQSQYDQLVTQRDSEKALYEKTRSDFIETKSKLEQLQSKYSEIEAKLHSNELLVQMSRNSKSSTAISHLTHLEEENKDIKMKLSLAEKDIVSLKIQLEDNRAHSKQYKNIADMMEKNLKESNESNEKTKYMLESKISDLVEKLKKSQADFEETLSARNQLEQEMIAKTYEMEEKSNLFGKEKSHLMNELELTKKQLENMEKILEERTKFRDDYAAKVSVLEEQEKIVGQRVLEIETELSVKIAELSDIKNELKSRELELESEKRSRQDALSNYESNEKILNENLTNLRTENDNLLGQINLLQQELSKLGQDLVILKNGIIKLNNYHYQFFLNIF